jgi:5-methylcytosine-specific restriction endonuclease McrA
MSNHTTSNGQIPDGYKRCIKGNDCVHPNGPTLPATKEYFYIHSTNHKLMAQCKKCFCQRAKQYIANDIEAHRIYQRRYREKNRDKINVANRIWYKKNAEKRKTVSLKWQQSHREEVRQNSRNWRLKNKAYIERKNNERRETLNNTLGSHTIRDLREILSLQNGKCLYCGCQLGDDMHLDHFIPISRGGSNDKANLAYACPPCNLSKHNTFPWNWPKWNGAYPVFHDGRLL